MFSAQVKEDLRNPWLRTIIAIVGVTVAVNIAFITYAFIVPPNLVVNDYYERGKTYFHDELVREQGVATAWRLHLMLPEQLHASVAQTCRLYVMDHDGKPVQAGRVTLMAYRPSNAADDFKVELTAVDTGTFAADVAFPLPGNWDVIARIDAGDQHFDTAQRIFVRK